MASAKAASRILVIDGCGLDCAKKNLDIEGITEFEHICLSDLGFEKGNSPVSETAIKKVVNAGRKLLKKKDQGLILIVGAMPSVEFFKG